jgi:hypothetical protein
MTEVAPREFRIYSRATYVMFTWGLPAFFALVATVLVLASVFATPRDRPPAFLAIFPAGVAGVQWILQSRRPNRIILHDDGRIEFVSPVRTVVVAARDIVSIKPSREFGFLVVRWGTGKRTLMNNFDKFHELLMYIKSVNPRVEIRGC